MSTEKPNFDLAEEKARDLRLVQTSDELALDMRYIDFDLPIIIDTFQNYAKLTGCTVEQLSPDRTLGDGYTIIGNDIFIILYNGDVPYNKHTNWTLAHEVGHVYLGHDTDGALQEVEAHWFAAELLSPESVIREIARKKGRVDHIDLQNLFGVSFTAATKRIDTLRRSTAWLVYKENEIVQKYNNLIEKYIIKFSYKKAARFEKQIVIMRTEQ